MLNEPMEGFDKSWDYSMMLLKSVPKSGNYMDGWMDGRPDVTDK